MAASVTRWREEALAEHHLSVLAGTVFSGLHNPGSWDVVWKQVTDVAALTQAGGGEHIVVIPAMYRDEKTGADLEPSTLTDDQWTLLTSQTDELGASLSPYATSVAKNTRTASRMRIVWVNWGFAGRLRRTAWPPSGTVELMR